MIDIGTQNRINFGLVAFTLTTEKLQNIGINAHVEYLFRLR